MHFPTIAHCFGLLLLLFCGSYLPPMLLAAADAGWAEVRPFAQAAAITGGVALLLMQRRPDWNRLRRHEGFLLTALFWIGLSAFGALPFILSPASALSLGDAFFESLSGLTTTGATILADIDALPRSLLLYRQLLQWLGGIGLVLIAIAVLPLLGIGGMQLYRASASLTYDSRLLRPRITETTRRLLFLYIGMSILCGVFYYLAGMSWFDALAHSLSTVSIGGFSTHDANFGFFADNNGVMAVAIVFMALAGINFGLHFQFINARAQRSRWSYFRDTECVVYLCLLAAASLICLLTLTLMSDAEARWQHGVRHVFQAVSIATTTGYVNTSFSAWPAFLPPILFCFAFIGGCAGSVGGGIKVVRLLLIFKESFRELRHLVHPKAVIPIKIGERLISDRVMRAAWSFLGLYLISFTLLTLGMMLCGANFETAFYAVLATINNLGPGLADVTDNYTSVSAAGKWLLCFAMLIGRLEVLSLLVLLTPTFWRR